VPQTPPATAIEQPHLRRELGLWGLVFYGLILIQPVAPMPLFGVVSQEARGHVVTTLLFALIAMLCTAVSYGRMAQAYPSAGSAYTYVGREIQPGLGFITGWCMTMEYMVNLVISVIWASKASMNVAPEAPFFVWAGFFAALFTLMNLRSIHATARTNEILVLAMCVVVVWFLAAAARYLWAFRRSPSRGHSTILPVFPGGPFPLARPSLF
jgi:putrescine importer